MNIQIFAGHGPGLLLAKLLVAGAASKDQASVALDAAFNQSRAIRLAEANYRDGAFCGDPYVHNCEREHCPTSDSYVGPASPLPRPTFDTDDHLGPSAIHPALLDGFALLPLALTAENGAKGAMLGEFSFSVEASCYDCTHTGIGPDSACEVCGGACTYSQEVTVPWDTIKDIYAAAVALFAKNGGPKA
ncbi:hypothetical protein QYE80_27395 [Pseudomonas tohonis]|nr:hypothetical protein L682_11150 [Pseudomonas alcaligenes OT 69]MDN4148730.1 hypothetical protein [Pseudomonas tohonis]